MILLNLWDMTREVLILTESKFYDWGDTFSKDAYMTMVCASRDAGKTYGLRRQFVRDFLKDGSRFVQLVRFKTDLAPVASGYFDKLQQGPDVEFPGHIFKTDTSAAWIAEKVPEGEKPDWQVIGYFGALSQMQQFKQRTFADVYRIMLDEAIIDRAMNRFQRYLPNEYYVLTQMIDSVSREVPGVPRKHEPRVYLLANALSMRNPYFAIMGIRKPPEFGKTWYEIPELGKRLLLDYVEPTEYTRRRRTETVAGALASLAEDAGGAMDNVFQDATGLFVGRKPSRAKFEFAIKGRGHRLAVWSDEREGYLYVTAKLPRDASPLYALTNDDGEFNALFARRNESVMRYLLEVYQYGLVRCDSDGTRQALADCLALYGLR